MATDAEGRDRTGGETRFGDDRVQDWKSFHSVVEGLAVHARQIARGEAA